MKTRNGFVSNSSSSSFIIIVPELRYQEALNRLPTQEKAVIQQMGPQKDNFLNTEVIKFYCQDGDGADIDNVEGVGDISTDMVWDKFIADLESGDHLTHSESY